MLPFDLVKRLGGFFELLLQCIVLLLSFGKGVSRRDQGRFSHFHLLRSLLRLGALLPLGLSERPGLLLGTRLLLL